jgi:hypothetical protein
MRSVEAPPVNKDAGAMPNASFSELAFEQVEIFLARNPGLPAVERSYLDMLRATDRLADVYYLLRLLSRLEPEIRALAGRHQSQTMELKDAV